MRTDARRLRLFRKSQLLADPRPLTAVQAPARGAATFAESPHMSLETFFIVKRSRPHRGPLRLAAAPPAPSKTDRRATQILPSAPVTSTGPQRPSPPLEVTGEDIERDRPPPRASTFHADEDVPETASPPLRNCGAPLRGSRSPPTTSTAVTLAPATTPPSATQARSRSPSKCRPLTPSLDPPTPSRRATLASTSSTGRA